MADAIPKVTKVWGMEHLRWREEKCKNQEVSIESIE